MGSRDVVRYSSRAFFFMAVVFIAASPLFWLHTQVNPAVVKRILTKTFDPSELYDAIMQILPPAQTGKEKKIDAQR